MSFALITACDDYAETAHLGKTVFTTTINA